VDLKDPAGRNQDRVGVGEIEPWRSGVWLRMSPVSEVQNGLDGITTTCGDVSFKAREQGQKHIDSETLALSGNRGRMRGVMVPKVGSTPSSWA
jgi:hypothetical protein